MDYLFSTAMSLMIAILVLLLGRIINTFLPFLQKNNIPEVVTGGLLGSLIFFGFYQFYGYSLILNKAMQDTFMLMFFASIGLSANFRKLKEGGKPLVIFLLCISTFVVIQNAVGMSVATLLNLDPLMGVMTGSIALIGGLGTVGAWGPIFENKYGIEGALTMGVASATFGMLIASLMGGPLARSLIRKHHLAEAHFISFAPNTIQTTPNETDRIQGIETQQPITVDHAILTLSLFTFALVFAEIMKNLTLATAFEMPGFIWAILGGVILRNSLEFFYSFSTFDESIDVFGNTVLALYLAMALVSLKLWQLAELAVPMLILLVAQTVAMWLFAKYVCFRVMGKNYESAVLATGLCGFGMGAMPNAIASMQAVTRMYGAAPRVFLIVPLVGAFFIDLVNVVVIQTILQLFG